MSDKVFRDPLYNYIAFDRQRDGWLIDLVNCREVQRLRRIHQLGISDLSHFFSLIFSISGRISKHIDDGVHLFCKERGFPGVV
jgi:hypothetical protein